MTVPITARLRLEPFENGHLDGLNAMNADPEVMRYLTGRPETREETLAAIERVKARWAASSEPSDFGRNSPKGITYLGHGNRKPRGTTAGRFARYKTSPLDCRISGCS